MTSAEQQAKLDRAIEHGVKIRALVKQLNEAIAVAVGDDMFVDLDITMFGSAMGGRVEHPQITSVKTSLKT